jgi:hypothetical protein
MARSNPDGSAAFGGTVLDLNPVLDTGPYADGDVLFDTVELPLSTGAVGNLVTLLSLLVLDESDQGQPFDLIFLDALNSLGTFNVAPNISDANARAILGRVQVLSSDYYDVGGARIAQPEFNPRILKAAAASRSLYVAGISRGTGTYAANGLRLKFGMGW